MLSVEEFVTLLEQLSLADNAARKSAEETYDTLSKNNSDEVPHLLLAVLSGGRFADGTRRLAGVLLRRCLVNQNKSKAYIMSATSLQRLRTDVLVSLKEETDTFLKSRICDVVGLLCEDDIEESEWPDLLPFTYSCLQSTHAPTLENGLALLGMVAPLFMAKFMAPSNLQYLIKVLSSCFNSTVAVDYSDAVARSTASGNVLPPNCIIQFRLLVASMRSLGDILLSLPQQSVAEEFYGLIPPMLTGLQNILTATQFGKIEQATAATYIEGMMDIAEGCPMFFAAPESMHVYFDPVVAWIMTYTHSGDTDDGDGDSDDVPTPRLHSSLAHLLIEFLVVVATGSPKVVRKYSKRTAHSSDKNYFAVKFFPICVEMMVRIKEDAAWDRATSPEEEDDDCDGDDGEVSGARDWDVGESALDRVCQALGLRSTYMLVSAQLLSLFTSATWQHQHAGLRYLGNYVEVSKHFSDKKQLAQHRKETLSILLQFTQNKHFRVRGAAYYALNQFLLMHGSSIQSGSMSKKSSSIEQQNLLINIVLPNVLSGLSAKTNPPPRVRRYAMACLINMIDCCIPSSMLDKPLPTQQLAGASSSSEASSGTVETNLTAVILRAVVQALHEGPVIIQEYCVSVIMSLAEVVNGAYFAQYYDDLMPILKQLLQYTQKEGLETFWGSVIECIALVGESCGKTKFYCDATEMMNHLAAMSTQVDEDSDVRRYILKAWVRIARCLGAEFLPFLSTVMEKLFQAISQDVHVEIPEGDDQEAIFAEMEKRSDIHMMESGSGEWVAIRSAGVEEQASACQLLVLLIEKMQEHFYPFVEQTVILLNPLLDSPHEDVRMYCVIALPELVRSTAKATAPDRTALLKISDFVLGLLVKFVETEGNLELIMTGLQSTKQVLNYLCCDWNALIKSSVGASEERKKAIFDVDSLLPSTSIRTLNVAQMQALTDCTRMVLKDSLQRRAVLRAEAAVSGGGAGGSSSGHGGDSTLLRDEDDAADENLFMRDSMELHFHVSDLICAIFKTHGDLFMECYMNNWHELVQTMTHKFCLQEDKQLAFSIISDVIEFGLPENSESTEAYLAQAIPGLVGICSSGSDDAPLRQTCGYALGVCVKRFPLYFAPHAASALQGLAVSIAVGEDPEEGEVKGPCTDNCVCAVGLILEEMEKLQFSSTDALLSGMLSQIPYYDIWGQWVDYLPLEHDLVRLIFVSMCCLLDVALYFMHGFCSFRTLFFKCRMKQSK